MSVYVEEFEGYFWINVDGWSYSIPSNGIHRFKKSVDQKNLSDGDIVSPMPGQILKLFVNTDEQVKEGQTLCVVEAMKMEHSLKSPFSGVVTKVECKEGQSVSLGDLLISIEADKS
jgi:biotin carboxyl carrier protein